VLSFLIKVRRNWFVSQVTFRGEPDYLADCLSDFRISEGKLSVWLIAEDKSNIDRVLAALAATRDKLQDMGYVLFDSGVLERCEIKFEKSEGGTPDSYANNNWHHDLTDLSVRQVAEFAIELCKLNWNGRLLPAEVALALEKSLENKYLAEEEMRVKREDITKYAERARRKASGSPGPFAK
jgi:hypothetical protein